MSDSAHIACPHCRAINRVPAAKLDDQPNCGSCQRLLFTGEPIELAIATEADPRPAARFGIRSIATLALFRGGREIARQAGAMGAQDTVRWVAAHAGR